MLSLSVSVFSSVPFFSLRERGSKKFQGSFKGISWKFKECPKKVFRMLQGSFKGISKKIKGWFNEVLSGLQAFLK